MRKMSVYDIVTRALMALLMLVMCAVLVRMATLPLPAEEAAEEMETTAANTPPKRDADGIIWSTKVDWEALYPAQEADAAAEETGLAWGFSHFVDRIDAAAEPVESAVAAWENTVDTYASDQAPFYAEMVETANAYDALLGWEIAGVESYNPVISAGNNYFLTCVARKNEQPRAEESIDLMEYCTSLGMQHLFVETPNKTCRSDPQSGITDFYNQNADRLLEALQKGGVDTLDLREELHAAGMDHHAAFFETDHHWKTETGLWAAGVLARTLNERCGFAIDLSLLDPAQFDYQVYEDWFLGSQGKKVTLSRAKPEDITLIYPKQETDLSIEIPSLSVEKRGDFSVLYRYAPVNVCDYYTQNPYAAYLYGDNALTRIVNHNCTNGKRVLMLGHSFDNSVIPFLALGVSEVDSIDLREFTGDLKTYLAENYYDAVVEFYTI